MDELVAPPELCRNAIRDQVAAADAAVEMIDHMAEHVGVSDLGRLDVLDFGCGVRFAQAFINRGVPVGRYVGVDVSRSVIDFLQSNVSDPRFEFFHIDAHNELYNPTGRPLSQLMVPEIEGRRFDLICLFSVFTHLAPPDYAAMLRLLRRFAKPDGRLFYTLFINEQTDGGLGYIDRLVAALESSEDPPLKVVNASVVKNKDETPDFVDAIPGTPLLAALYSRRHAIELIDGSGWEVIEVSPPSPHLQHHVVCSPAE